ncbi:MAG TPA: class I SAM-dependent methyltransferase [Thermoplasmata archaeon]|nr:class I SAM-dependent methyltransferase [Thermoplasmata archaeon]
MSSDVGRRAPDGSPYPVPGTPTFERDVRAMFTHIAIGYDRFDHLVSLGNDFVWRPRAFWDLDRFRGAAAPGRVLDVGCGPGNLSRLAAHRFPSAGVVGTDVTAAMLTRARAETTGRRPYARTDWAAATAGRLPFKDGSFDLLVSAFVLRNLASLPAAFGEFRRVLRPGGSALLLEITEPPSDAFRRLFHAYFDSFVPWLGAALGASGPYRYLPESLRRLPGRGELLRLLDEAGFARAVARPQSLGIVTTYLAEAGAPASGVPGRSR